MLCSSSPMDELIPAEGPLGVYSIDSGLNNARLGASRSSGQVDARESRLNLRLRQFGKVYSESYLSFFHVC